MTKTRNKGNWRWQNRSGQTTQFNNPYATPAEMRGPFGGAFGSQLTGPIIPPLASPFGHSYGQSYPNQYINQNSYASPYTSNFSSYGNKYRGKYKNQYGYQSSSVQKRFVFKKKRNNKKMTGRTLWNEIETREAEKERITRFRNLDLGLSDANTVIVNIPKSLKSKPREALEAILSQCEDDEFNIRACLLKFDDIEGIKGMVKTLRSVTVDGKNLEVYNNLPKAPQTQPRLIKRTCEIPRGWDDIESVKHYFNACHIMVLNRKEDGPTKLCRLKFKSQEDAEKAMNKAPMMLEGMEVSMKHIPFQTTSQSDGDKVVKKQQESTRIEDGNDETMKEDKTNKEVDETKKQDDEMKNDDDEDDEMTIIEDEMTIKDEINNDNDEGMQSDKDEKEEDCDKVQDMNSEEV